MNYALLCSCERSEAKKLPTPFNPPPTTLFFVEATCCRLVTSKAVSSCLQAALAEHSYGSERSEAKQKSFLLYPSFSFSLGEEGVLLRLWLVTASRPTYEASPSLLRLCLATAGGRPAPVCLQLRACEAETPTYPTARERLLHCVQVYVALSRYKF